MQAKLIIEGASRVDISDVIHCSILRFRIGTVWQFSSGVYECR